MHVRLLRIGEVLCSGFLAEKVKHCPDQQMQHP